MIKGTHNFIVYWFSTDGGYDERSREKAQSGAS
jgi:hypothetical protein